VSASVNDSTASASSGASSSPGLLASARGLVSTSAALLGNRLALLGIELSEEGSRLLAILLYGGIAVLCLGAGLIFLAIFITLALWDSNRLLALGMFAALFLGAGTASALVTRHFLRSRARWFAASLDELKRDKSQLTGRSP
jgi:uncharacterized membrane protein YqjE